MSCSRCSECIGQAHHYCLPEVRSLPEALRAAPDGFNWNDLLTDFIAMGGHAAAVQAAQLVGDHVDIVFPCKHCDHIAKAEECTECEELLPEELLAPLNPGGDLFCVECRLRLNPAHQDVS